MIQYYDVPATNDVTPQPIRIKKRRVSSNQKTLDEMNKRRKLTMDDEFSDFMNTDETSNRRCVKRKLDVFYDRGRMKRTNISLSDLRKKMHMKIH